MKISIIIPVYNVERYIEKCITSCVNQDIPLADFEIIIVNDGTEDNSEVIAQKIARNYSNIKIISQKNQGLSIARNRGLQVASGEYIWFIDSDDWIEENCLGGICEQLNGNLDLLQLQYRYTYDDIHLNQEPQICKIETILTGKEITERGGIPDPAPFTIYRKKFLIDNHLSFFPGIYHEDSEFKPRVLYLAQSIKSYDKVVYNYYQRKDGSIMSHFRLKNGKDILLVNNNLLSFVYDNGIEKKYRKSFYQNIGININTLLLGMRQLNDSDKKILVVELKKNKKQFFKMYQSGLLKYKIESLLFLISIKVGLLIYNKIR